MTYKELVNELSRILPNATFGEDNDNQVIIFTNTFVSNEELVDFDIGKFNGTEKKNH